VDFLHALPGNQRVRQGFARRAQRARRNARTGRPSPRELCERVGQGAGIGAIRRIRFTGPPQDSYYERQYSRARACDFMKLFKAQCGTTLDS